MCHKCIWYDGDSLWSYIYISLFSSVVTILYLCKWGWKNYTQRAVTFVIFLIGIKYVSNIFYMFLSFARNVASESPLRICENVIWLLSHNFSMMMFWNETFSTLLGFWEGNPLTRNKWHGVFEFSLMYAWKKIEQRVDLGRHDAYETSLYM